MIEAARELARGALAAMESSRQRIDDLNVYPVPDGDTGTNLLLTTRAVVEAAESSTASDRAQLAKELTRAALMGARGNSGVILSQIVRGAADVLGEADSVSPEVLATNPRTARSTHPFTAQTDRIRLNVEGANPPRSSFQINIVCLYGGDHGFIGTPQG